MTDVVGVAIFGFSGACSLFATCYGVIDGLGILAALFGLLTMFAFMMCGMALVDEE